MTQLRPAATTAAQSLGARLQTGSKERDSGSSMEVPNDPSMPTYPEASAFAVTSADGTPIAFDRVGEGPPLVVVGGILCDCRRTRPLAVAFSSFATVLNVDRRGRGASGDTPPYSLKREFDDLAAIIEAAGSGATLYGHSSGAGLALRAAAHGLPVTRLILHEPPSAPMTPRARPLRRPGRKRGGSS